VFSVACGAQSPAVERSIALLLPSQQTVFAHAAEALREGFFAAHKLDGQGIALQVIEVDDDPQQLSAALLSARSRGVSVVVGPLPRTAVNAVVDGGHARLPLVALNYPDHAGNAPPTLIALGLPMEAEAQRIVQVALSQYVSVALTTRPRFIVLVGAGALERRTATAYVGALRTAGQVPTVVDVTPEALESLDIQLANGRYEAVFLALAAREAAQLRARIPRGLLVFATSMVNEGEAAAASLAADLEGVRFVDMPWLLDPQHPAVMAYPQPAQALPADMARLYALGIDAFRIAALWMGGRTQFEIDGVTGHLRVDRAQGPRVERTPMSAVYRKGAIEREDVAR
jgi:uncharacterized protein